MSVAQQEPWQHPFEVAGLGKAPFVCVGVSEKTYQACHGAPVQPAGTCDFCGTGIRYAYAIQSSDRRVFSVGCDCVERTGDTKLDVEAKRAWKAFERDLRERARAERLEEERPAREAAAAAKAARDARGAWILAANAAICDAPCSIMPERAFIGQLVGQLRADWPLFLSDKEATFLAAALSRAALPPSRHVGAVGDRFRNLLVTYEGGPVFETMFGMKRMAKFRLLRGQFAGSLLVWSTVQGIVAEGPRGKNPVDLGDIVNLTATVKSHGSYANQAQTFVSRAVLSVP